MRILLDGHSLGARAGGNESYVRGLLEGLVECTDPIEVIVSLPRAVDPTALPGGNGRASAVRIHYRPLRSSSSCTRLGLEMPRLLRRQTVQVAHFQYVSPVTSPCPVVLSVHDASFREAPASLGWMTAARLRLTSVWSLPGARAVLVPSTYAAETLLRHYPRLRGRMTVVPLAASRRFVPDQEADDPARRRALGLPDRYLLYVGRRGRRKNLGMLVRAYAEAVGRAPELPPLCLVGPSCSADRALARLAASLELTDRVRIIGFAAAASLPAVYRGAALTLFPGRNEGFGLPMVEAMACGQPVVAAHDGALPEVSGGAAILVPASEPSRWADAIVRLTDDRSLRREIARRGEERARAFDWRETARRTVAAYTAAASLAPVGP